MAGAQNGCRGAVVSADLSLSLRLRHDNALIADAVLALPSPASVYLEYGNPSVGWLRTPTGPPATATVVPLLRLQPSTEYEVRAFALDESGCPTRAAIGRVASRTLPAALRMSHSSREGEPSTPLHLVDHRLPRPLGEVRLGMLVALDGAGQVVWYHTVPDDVGAPPGLAPALVVREAPNGNLVYQVLGYGFVEITRDARLVRRLPLPAELGPRRAHHDFLIQPDGSLLFLSKQDRPIPLPDGSGERQVRGDTLMRLQPATGELRTVWSAFDLLDPNARPDHWHDQDERVEDWTHANSIWIGPRGNLVLSLRHLDQVISLAPDLSAIEWRLGGVNSDFAFPEPTDRFWGQHDARELPDGRLLLFDNGNHRPEGEYSRGLELELDFAAMTARKVWEYRTRPDTFTPIVGSADRLPNGSTLLNFGYVALQSESADGNGNILTVEALTDGSVAWRHRMSWEAARGSRYRALPLESLAGEQPIAEPTPLDAGGR